MAFLESSYRSRHIEELTALNSTLQSTTAISTKFDISNISGMQRLTWKDPCIFGLGLVQFVSSIRKHHSFITKSQPRQWHSWGLPNIRTIKSTCVRNAGWCFLFYQSSEVHTIQRLYNKSKQALICSYLLSCSLTQCSIDKVVIAT